MTAATYGERFREFLEGEISRGGEVERIVRLVQALKDLDPVVRHVTYTDWLRDAALTCTQCGFSVRSDRPDLIQEDDEVRCDWCHAPAPMFREPVLGWQRTWQR